MAAPPLSLEAIIKDELREHVRRLVREVIAEELNGYAGVSGLLKSPDTLGEHPEPNGNGAVSPPEATGALPATTEPPPQMAAETRRCSMCGELKPLDQFLAGRAQCKPCRSAYQARRYRERKAQAKASDDDGGGLASP